MILRIDFELLWFLSLCSKNTRLNFLIYKRRKENSQSLSNKLFSQWENGATPSDFINAYDRIETNCFMSNRGRQNVASYFVTNSIWIAAWAAYFESQLIDYDLQQLGQLGLFGRSWKWSKEAPLFQYSKTSEWLW
jgi:deoxyribodipyrimidine photo-lyase